MESIIFLVLFGIVSSVIQSVIKNNKRQQQLNADVQGIKPKIAPIYEAVSKSHTSMEPEIRQEVTRYDAYENLSMLDKEEASASAPNLILAENITFNELQRSIIMAEVLGKPKALRKAIR